MKLFAGIVVALAVATAQTANATLEIKVRNQLCYSTGIADPANLANTTTPTAAVFHADFKPIAASRPARPGEVVILRALGPGPTEALAIIGWPGTDQYCVDFRLSNNLIGRAVAEEI